MRNRRMGHLRLTAALYGLASLLLPGMVGAEDCNGNGIDDAIDLAGIDPERRGLPRRRSRIRDGCRS